MDKGSHLSRTPFLTTGLGGSQVLSDPRCLGRRIPSEKVVGVKEEGLGIHSV